jgi:predicted enzyme related to lactoylglutathione lyase
MELMMAIRLNSDPKITFKIIKAMSNDQKPKTGTIGWTEIVTHNQSATDAFYTQMFGWSQEQMQMPDCPPYTIFKSGEDHVAGSVTPPDAPEAPSTWLTYVNVEDLDAAVAKARELGATIRKERVDLPMGSFAIITDPQGATFAVWQPTGSCDEE